MRYYPLQGQYKDLHQNVSTSRKLVIIFGSGYFRLVSWGCALYNVNNNTFTSFKFKHEPSYVS